ncbi:putative epimerase/dehydratase WbiI [Bacteroides sp. CAG:530]|nr:putative epimerase/dehydratase WbiI [Bacteroides sp. CAG:530]
MKVFGKFFNWYFGRGALPYWCIMIFDLMVCFLSGVFIVWLRHPASDVLAAWPQLMHTLGLFAVLNFISFRVFHTYSGILRYSQFIDLMRVTNACVLSMLLAFVFSLCALNFGWDDFFFIFTGRKIITMYLGNILAMCIPRVLVKLIFDNALVSSSAMNTLVYGTRAGSIAITNNVRDEKPVHFLIKGYVGDDREHYNERLMGKKIYSVHEDLIPIIESQCIKAFLVSPLRHEEFTKNRKLQDLLIERGIKIFIAQNAEEWKKNQDPQGKVGLREVKIEDLLPREEIQVDMDSVGALLRGKRVLITGAAGSIGSEMVRQIAIYKPAEMMLIDQAETPLHDVRLMMKNNYSDIKAETVVTSICKEDRMEEIFSHFKPDYVFHAAAYKHVPMMEDNPSESVQNNVWGTKVIADLSVKYGVKKFVMISTDKAVNPTNVMGCSKRICEIYVQSLDKAIKDGKIKGVTQFVTTRFGNVLGSNGSVIPLFREQLAKGGPLTVTHPKIIRFFMLVHEACKLVLEAGTHGKGGEIFVFDMGEPVRIADLAKRMIQLSGAKNVEIKYTGLREGEKLYEEVLNENENTLPSFHKKIRIAMVRNYEYEDALREIEELRDISVKYDDMETVRKMKQIVPEYVSKHSRYEVLDAPQAEAAEVAQSAS